MSTYTVLTGAKTTEGSIKEWLNHSGAPSATLLTEAQSWIYQRLRVRQMITTATGTLAADADTITLPTGYKGSVLFMFTGSSSVSKAHVTKKTIDFVVSNFNYDGSGNRTTGRPQYWAADASNIQFEVKADQGYPYLFMYYKALAALAATTNETNFLTDDYPTLLRATVLYKGYEWTKNEREKVYWLGIATSEIGKANEDSDLELAGTDLAVSIGEGNLSVSIGG